MKTATHYVWNSIEAYRDEAIEAAKDLRYGDEVIDQLKKAKDGVEIERIMATARRKMRN